MLGRIPTQLSKKFPRFPGNKFKKKTAISYPITDNKNPSEHSTDTSHTFWHHTIIWVNDQNLFQAIRPKLFKDTSFLPSAKSFVNHTTSKTAMTSLLSRPNLQRAKPVNVGGFNFNRRYPYTWRWTLWNFAWLVILNQVTPTEIVFDLVTLCNTSDLTTFC